jgi:Tfp pilus assembly protein PilF
MRFLKWTAASAALVILLCHSYFLEAAPGQAISGRLMFDNFTFECERQCTVTLLASGVQPVQTVYADLVGNFTFNGVPPGRYTIRVEIDGVEVANQPVEAFGSGPRINVMIPSVQRPAAASRGSSAGSASVDLSEFTGQYPKKAVSYFEKGSELLKKKKLDEAAKYFRSAIDLAPTFYQAHHQLGVTYREAGKLPEAESEFLLAHELNSSTVEPLLNLTALYIQENETERAVKTGEEAVKINPRSAPAFFNLGFALYKAAQLDRAEAALKRALDLAPKMANVRLMLANVYLKLRRYDSTLEQLNTYIAENPRGDQLQQAVEMRDRLLQVKKAEQP